MIISGKPSIFLGKLRQKEQEYNSRNVRNYIWQNAPIIFAEDEDPDNFKYGAIKTGRFRKVKNGD